MTTVSILSVTNDEGSQVYQAIAGSLRCNGKTPGEALDAITAELGDSRSNTLVVLQNGRPDVWDTQGDTPNSVRHVNYCKCLLKTISNSCDFGTGFAPHQ